MTQVSALERFDLTGRVAIVTGATKGIGRGIADGLAQAGASVVVSSRKQDLCDAVAAEIEAATGQQALGLACHVGQWDAVPAFVRAACEWLGHVDVLVNNAGINPAPTPVVDLTLEYWQKLQSVNLEGPLRLSALLAPHAGSRRWKHHQRVLGRCLHRRGRQRRVRREQGRYERPHQSDGQGMGAVARTRQRHRARTLRL